MATAEELLRNSVAQPDPEGHIVVGGDRFITVPDNLKRLGVQYDHNMETVVFDCPRYWDKRDMSQMAVYINYARSDGYMDRYPVDAVTADGDIMHFEWTISRNVTEVAGALAFLVCVMVTDDNGNEERHWNSELCSECYVSQGMETEEHPALMYPDEVTQLLLRMATVEQINVQAEEMQAIYESAVEVANAAEETKNQALDASGYIRNTYANTIKDSVSGEIVRVDDVSPIEHDVKCYVHGKNLVDISAMVSTVASNNFVDNGDGTYTLTKIAVGDSVKRFSAGDTLQKPIKANTEFRISCTVVENTTVNGLCFILYDVDGQPVGYPSMTDIQRRSFSYNADIHSVRLYLLGSEQNGVSVTIRDLQIELGAVATAYEPYIDPSTVTVRACGKNMFTHPYDGTVYGNGMTFTDSGDGTIVVNGTNNGEGNSVYYLAKDAYITVPAGTYSCSPNVAGLAIMGVEQGGGYFTFCSVNKNYFVLNEPTTFRSIYIQVLKGATNTYSNLVIRPMLEYGPVQSIFEPYSGENAMPDVNGLFTVTSKSPTMTLFTDTPGVVVEVEYNVDTEKRFLALVTDDRVQAAVNERISDEQVQTVVEGLVSDLDERVTELENNSGDASLTVGYNGNLWLNGKDTGIKMPTDNTVRLMFDYESVWLEGDDYYSKFENAKSAFLDGNIVTLGWCEPYSSNVTRCPCIRYNEGWDHPGGVEYLLFSAWTDGDVLEAYRLTPDGQVELITKQIGGGGEDDPGEGDPGEDDREEIRFSIWGYEFGVPSGYTWREAIDQGLIYGVSENVAYGCVACGETYTYFGYSDIADKVWLETCPLCDGSVYDLAGSDGPDAGTVSPDEPIYAQTYYHYTE